MDNWKFGFKDNTPGSRLKKIGKSNYCYVCGERISMAGQRRLHKGDCKKIYINAYVRWQKGLDY